MNGIWGRPILTCIVYGWDGCLYSIWGEFNSKIFLDRVISLIVALGLIRSTEIDGLSEKLQFDQICGQFLLPLLPVIPDCTAPCNPHWPHKSTQLEETHLVHSTLILRRS